MRRHLPSFELPPLEGEDRRCVVERLRTRLAAEYPEPVAGLVEQERGVDSKRNARGWGANEKPREKSRNALTRAANRLYSTAEWFPVADFNPSEVLP